MAWFEWETPSMGAIAGVINKLFKLRLALWIGKAMTALGLGFAANKFIYQPLIDQAVTAWHALPAAAANWAHALGLDVAVSIILSAYGIRGVERVFLSRKYESPL